MSPAVRTVSSATAGALVAAAVILGQPALADHASSTDRHAITTADKRRQITSRQIKNHTIKSKDLSGSVTGLLGLAATSLQSIPANGITRDKMADNSVGSAEVINNSLVASDLAQNAVGANEIAPGAVGPNQVKDGSLTSADVTTLHGVLTVAIPSVPSLGCATFTQVTNPVKVLDGDLILTTAPAWSSTGNERLLTVTARPVAVGSSTIQFDICNSTAAAIAPTAASYQIPYAVIDN